VALTQVQDVDKQRLSDYLSFIENTLQKFWADHDCFIDLQERILVMRLILEEIGNDTSKGRLLDHSC